MGGDIEGIPILRRHILPAIAVGVGLAFLGGQVVGDFQRHAGVFGHAEAGTVFPEYVHGKVFAYVNVAGVLGPLQRAVGFHIKLAARFDDAVDQRVPGGFFGGGVFRQGGQAQEAAKQA